MNKALLFIALSVCILLSACSRRLAVVKPAPLKFEFKGKLRSVAFLEGYYYLLTYDSGLYRFEKSTNALDSTFYVDFTPGDYNRELSSIYINSGSVYGQNEYKYYLLKGRKWKYLKKVVEEYPGNKILEDKGYVISSICQGEFGGSLFFKSKKKRKVYETECTCAFSVQKQADVYLVTETLSHGGGSARFFTIPDPTKLPVYKKANFKKGYRKYTDEETPRLGKANVFDSYWMLFLSKFESDRTLHLITLRMTDRFELPNNILSVEVIENNKLRLVREIKSQFLNKSTNFAGSEHQPFITYDNEKNTGFIDFSNNKVVFYNFPLKK